MAKRSFWLISILAIFSLILAACGPSGAAGEPTAPAASGAPGAAATSAAGAMATEAPGAAGTEAPTAAQAGSGQRVVVEFWSTDNEQDRVDRYQQVAQRFMEANPNIEVRIVPVEEGGISQRLATALAANQPPDLVRMGVERSAALAADGLLDEEAASTVIGNVGEDDFRGGLLEMVTNPDTDARFAIPYDGWIQALWYRQDVFDQLGLQPPVSWDDINAACDQLPGNMDLLYGVGIGTDPGQNYGHQIFEQVAMSNGAWPFDDQGNVTMNTPEMVQALEFYAGLQRCALPGPQYWRGARETYELGQSGMLFYSTYIMDDLVVGSEQEGGGTVQIAVEDLAGKTGFAPSMKGPNGEATYGQLVTLAIPKGAAPEAAQVAQYFLQEGYQDVLSLAPFGKVPVLQSAVEEWRGSSEYFQNYSEETLNQITNGYDTMQRWLFRPGYTSEQRAVIGDIEGRLLIPQVVSRIALEGSMTPESGAEWLQQQVEAMYAERQQ